MRRAWLFALVACGGSQFRRPATYAPMEWNITLASPHFEVQLKSGSRLLVIEDGRQSAVGDAQSIKHTSYAEAPELEQLDRDFAAKSAAEGGSAWAAMFAPDGAEWSDGKRVEQAQIGDVMGRVLLGATLQWEPTASGQKDDLGFTIGTYVLASKHSAEREAGSYCTIWRRQPDGSWKILLDVGSNTKS